MSEVILFISGGAGVGKTTLLRSLAARIPHYIYQDLDELYLDEQGEACLDLSPASQAWLQGRVDAFVFSQDKPIVFAGVNFLQTNLRAQCSVVLNTSPWRVMMRLWRRAQDYGENRWWAWLGGVQAWQMKRCLVRQGFLPADEHIIYDFLEGRRRDSRWRLLAH